MGIMIETSATRRPGRSVMECNGFMTNFEMQQGHIEATN